MVYLEYKREKVVPHTNRMAISANGNAVDRYKPRARGGARTFHVKVFRNDGY
jgi:hypothetical protein